VGSVDGGDGTSLKNAGGDGGTIVALPGFSAATPVKSTGGSRDSPNMSHPSKKRGNNKINKTPDPAPQLSVPTTGPLVPSVCS